MAPGLGWSPPRSGVRMPLVSWTGWSRRIPRWCGCISTVRPPAGTQGAWANHKNPHTEPANHAIGRSRGGLTTKIHLIVDGAGRALAIALTAGNVNDTTVLPDLLARIRVPRRRGRPRTRPLRVIADKGYSSRCNRRLLAARGIKVTIPERADQAHNRRRRGPHGGRPYAFDAEVYKRRNVVERGFNTLKNWRGIATRYDRLARNYLGALHLASTLDWLT